MRNWRFEFNDDYQPTQHLIGILFLTVTVLGLEVRPSLPDDDPDYPGYGAAVGIVILNWWMGFYKFRKGE